ncbi:hypothetical protein D9M68_862930 [compost metagenome]
MVLGILLVAPTGTTAPFSAMSGATTVTWSLLAAVPPRAFTASAMVLMSKPARSMAACAWLWVTMPNDTSVAKAPVVLRATRRELFMGGSCEMRKGRECKGRVIGPGRRPGSTLPAT